MSKLNKVPNSVWVIGIASLLITCSAAMFFSVFALYLNSLGIAVKDISLVGGIVEGFGYILKVLSGIVSDFLKRRKLVFAFGVLFTSISRPLLILFQSATCAIIAKFLDRLGNGIQATPRDALVSELAPKEIKGKCLGIRQSLGTLGSVIGALLAIIILHLYKNDFHPVFIAICIPSVIAFLIIVFFVKDSEEIKNVRKNSSKDKTKKFKLADIKNFDSGYWVLMIIVAVFMLCRYNESMIILYGQSSFNLSIESSVWIVFIYNISSSFSAYYTGNLVDRYSSTKLISIGIAVIILANILIMILNNIYVFLLGVTLWGLQIGLMQNVFESEIIDFVPKELRGTGFGIFYFIMAISVLLANIFVGRLQVYGQESTFIYSALLGGLTALLFFFVKKKGYLKKSCFK